MREIQYLAEGDTVYTYNISSGQIEEAIIPNIFARNSQEFVKLHFAGDTIVCTPEHPFFVNNNWLEAKELKRGDSLFTFSGCKVAIDSIFAFRTDTATAVYNLEASGNHNYYVSAGKVLVHNKNALAKMSGILRDAAKGKGNFGLGSSSYNEAIEMGKAWVGKGYTIASDGKTMISKNGLRQFRPPTFKPKLKIKQANFEQRFINSGKWQGNGHLDIIE